MAWKRHRDPATGQEYYRNSITQQTQWDLPAPLKKEQEKLAAEWADSNSSEVIHL